MGPLVSLLVVGGLPYEAGMFEASAADPGFGVKAGNTAMVKGCFPGAQFLKRDHIASADCSCGDDTPAKRDDDGKLLRSGPSQIADPGKGQSRGVDPWARFMHRGSEIFHLDDVSNAEALRRQAHRVTLLERL
jgi:hypothetical protein